MLIFEVVLFYDVSVIEAIFIRQDEVSYQTKNKWVRLTVSHLLHQQNKNGDLWNTK